MKSLALVALAVIASWSISCTDVNAQTPASGTSAPSPVSKQATPTTSAGKTEAAPGRPPVPSPSNSAESMPPVPSPSSSADNLPPVPSPSSNSSEQVVVNESSANNAHLSTPGGEGGGQNFPALREFLEDSQNAHDKLIVDRFLVGVAVLFAIIAAALLFSLPPKPREQKE
jgi:hypothetical protein